MDNYISAGHWYDIPVAGTDPKKYTYEKWSDQISCMAVVHMCTVLECSRCLDQWLPKLVLITFDIHSLSDMVPTMAGLDFF